MARQCVARILEPFTIGVTAHTWPNLRRHSITESDKHGAMTDARNNLARYRADIAAQLLRSLKLRLVCFRQAEENEYNADLALRTGAGAV